jgi:hypothetical protein
MALCFEVTVNEEAPAVAGTSEAGVLTAILTHVSARSELTLDVGAMVSDSREHLDWIERDLNVGDTVVIRIVESGSPDLPVERHREEPSFVADQERAYYEHLPSSFDATSSCRGWPRTGGSASCGS